MAHFLVFLPAHLRDYENFWKGWGGFREWREVLSPLLKMPHRIKLLAQARDSVLVSTNQDDDRFYAVPSLKGGRTEGSGRPVSSAFLLAICNNALTPSS